MTLEIWILQTLDHVDGHRFNTAGQPGCCRTRRSLAACRDIITAREAQGDQKRCDILILRLLAFCIKENGGKNAAILT